MRRKRLTPSWLTVLAQLLGQTREPEAVVIVKVITAERDEVELYATWEAAARSLSSDLRDRWDSEDPPIKDLDLLQAYLENQDEDAEPFYDVYEEIPAR
ncbi:hypothetical protein [Nocardiopsis synnemataformans]|uniref:hypothetical protein n=1 Tax=Nocardiopsis synnemataformans TaxID=61305 RepID=UPI003EBE582E